MNQTSVNINEQMSEQTNGIEPPVPAMMLFEAPTTTTTKSKQASKEWNPNWNEYTRKEKVVFVVLTVVKSIVAILCLYLFLLSLNFMTLGFNMVTYYALQAGEVIGFLLSNPFACLAVGVVVTALMQNATATSSIAIILVGAGIIPSVKSSVPIIMGANIGTCITNSFIALTVGDDPHVFKKAFSAAVLNDGFNLLTTLVILPIEILSDFIYLTADAITNALPLSNPDALASANFIGFIVNPVCNLFVVLNSTALNLLSSGDRSIKEVALRCCLEGNTTVLVNQSVNVDVNTTNSTFAPYFELVNQTQTVCIQECKYPI